MYVRIYLAWVISQQCLYGVYLLKHRASSHQNGWKFYFHKIRKFHHWLFFLLLLLLFTKNNKIKQLHVPLTVHHWLLDIYILLQLRVWTTPAQVNQTKYALGVGKDIITYYEQYYNLGYPLPKQGE